MFALLDESKIERIDYYDKEKKTYITDYGDFVVETSKDMILKISYNIEDLCNAFVLVAEDYDYFQTTRKTTRKWVFDDLADAEDKEEEIGKGISRIIYGAIWTKKGLIYVAKMNEKGELELL